MATKSKRSVLDVADTSFLSVNEKTLVAEAAKSMYERESDTLIVTRTDPELGNIPVGIVTQRDLIYRVLAQNKGPYKVNVGSAMSSPVTVISRESSIDEALEIMRQNGFSRLPVVSPSGEIIALVTMKMLIRKGSVDERIQA